MMNLRVGLPGVLLLLCSTVLVQAAVETLPPADAATGIDINKSNPYFDWIDGFVGTISNSGEEEYRTAVDFNLIVPPRATVNSAVLTFAVTNGGGSRGLELNLFAAGGKVGLGAIVMSGEAHQWTVPGNTNVNVAMDVTTFVSNLASNGAAGLGFNLRELGPATNYYHPMILQMGASAPQLVVDYTPGLPPEGHFYYEFDASNGPLIYNFGELLGLEQLDSGKLKGYHASGLVHGTAKGVTVRFAYKESQGGSDYDRYSYVMSVDPTNHTLSGIKTVRAVTVTCDTIIGPCHRHTTVDKGYVSWPLGATHDGSWKLDLAMARNGAALSGNAFITFPNGDVWISKIRGKYSERKQQALLLVGSGAGPSLSVTLSVPDMVVQRIRGTMAGQKIDWGS
jgi:hypothetical protein